MSNKHLMENDYDYHRNTGELPDYFGNNKRSGCSSPIGCLALIIFLIGLAFYTCTKSIINSDKKDTPSSYSTSPNITPPPPVIDEKSQDSMRKVMDKLLEEKEYVPVTDDKPTVSTMPSVAYEKGYERGYEDGEEDAVDGNGYEASFDEYCHYKGKQRHEYEEGYEEGYETGYFDNAYE